MNRRTFLKRFAAIAAAVAVAPKVGTAEARPVRAVEAHVTSSGSLYTSAPMVTFTGGGSAGNTGVYTPAPTITWGNCTHTAWQCDCVAEARAEGYERGRAIEAAKRESKAQYTLGNSAQRWPVTARSGLESPYSGLSMLPIKWSEGSPTPI